MKLLVTGGKEGRNEAVQSVEHFKNKQKVCLVWLVSKKFYSNNNSAEHNHKLVGQVNSLHFS